jgi:hypothetical protein
MHVPNHFIIHQLFASQSSIDGFSPLTGLSSLSSPSQKWNHNSFQKSTKRGQSQRQGNPKGSEPDSDSEQVGRRSTTSLHATSNKRGIDRRDSKALFSALTL